MPALRLLQGSYASIDHQLPLDRLAAYIPNRRVLNLIGQYLKRYAERDGLCWECNQRIALGCPLSPLMGAFFPIELDVQRETLGLCFVRCMDDILMLAQTRWKLRRAVTVINQVLAGLHYNKHPNKICIGRVEKGFDFLDCHFRPGRLEVAHKTLGHFVARASRLYG